MTKDGPSAGGPPPPAGASRGPPRKDHRRELEALRAELEAERLRAQEARRRCALEARELREAAERERQLLADQLRSKWEQQRAREARQLREECRRQREAEIRQLLRWKEAELREAQELLQRERDAAMRQARDLQRQLAEELVSRRGGGGGGAGLSGECRARLQEVLGKLRWEVDGDQAARIRHLKAELELERSLFLKYILERFEGEQAPPGWPQRTRQAPLQQHSLAKNRPRSLESLVTGSSDATAAAAAASKSRSLDRNLSRCDSPPRLVSPPEGGFPKDSSCPQRPSAPQNALENETCSDDGAKEEKSVHAPPEGKVSSSGSGQESVPPAATQQQGWLASSSYSQLVKQNTELLKALLDLEQRCTHLKEENILLRKSSFPEMKEKVKRLKRKNGELADIAKRLEERAKKLQESSLKVGSAPIPLTMTCSDMNLYKTTFARQRAKDLSEQASALLAKDQQLEALQRECWELRAKLTTGKERTYLFSINDFDRLLRESQREVLRLQRQIMLKNLRESLQPSKIGNGAENNENCSSKTNSNTEYQLQVLKKKFVEKCKQCENLKHEMEKKQKTSDDLELQLNEVLSENVRFAEENSQLHEKTERTQKIENENAELKIKLLQATEDRNSAIQFTKGLEIKVENLEHVIRNMKEIAERQQQLESEHKETLLVLKNKEEEIQHLQQIQAEIKREHEESVQILESQVRELENQYHSQTEHFNLLSQELERLQIKKSGILESENSSKCCLNSEEEKPDEVALETDKVSINLQLENQVSSKLHVFLARYSYDPFAGPNKNPEVELPLTAGEYVYIYGGMDEDGFYEGELMDGRRGMVPSNLVEEVSRNDLMSFLPSETSDFALHEMDFPCQSTNSEEKSDSPDEDRNVNLQSNRLGRELCDYQIAVPYPQNLTLIKQFSDKGNSDKMRCTFLVGNSFHIAPTLLQLRNITATSAEITWLPSNSNYSHAVYLNEKEYNVTNSGVYWYTFQNLEPGSQYSIKVETQDCNKVLEIPQGNWERKSAAITFTTPSTEPPDAPLDVQVQPSSSAGFLVITWLPVTIDAVGSSNGVKVIGYAVYINGQKVTESMSPTSGNVLLAVSQLHTFQETLKVSVRTVSPFGESEDSVPALIPPTLLRVPGSLWSKSVASTQASELTEDGHIHTVTGASSSIFSHMDMANTDTNFTVHFTSDCKELVAPMVVNISRNPMPFTTQMTSHNQGESDSILCRSNGKQSSDYALPSLMCEQSANPMLKLNLHAENMEREKAVSTAQPNSTKVKVYGQDTDTTAKYPSIQHRAVNSGANCSDSEPSVSSIKLEQKDSCRDGGTRKIFLQEEMGRLSKKKHTKQMKWLCDELPDLSVSQVENEEEQLSRTESRETHFGDQNDIPDFSDGEEEESLAYKRSIYVQKDAEPQDRAIPPAELAKDTGMTMTLKADRVTPSVPDFTDSGRLFVTLFDYDPITMSPNCNTAEEELSFKKGQILKVIGDKDVDGFYRGECEGKEGYIPCNMVSEIYIESKKAIRFCTVKPECGCGKLIAHFIWTLLPRSEKRWLGSLL
uniref:Peripheral-type benzodiazepine receptor-associated protein 1 n=1 Tax=Varanus komodoensis TaxID=61221 RepID=A0A8D2JCL6_VARKO